MSDLVPRTTCPPVRRRRRGATLVLVAVLLVALLGVCAIAIDLSRLHVGVNELQTAVDAAALRGALALQRDPKTSPKGEVTTFLSSNSVVGAAPSSPDVKFWNWNPNTNTGLSYNSFAPGIGINAVQVTATLSGGLLFGRALALGVPRPTRSATAVVASVGLTCVRPWIFDLTKVFGRSSPPVEVTSGSTPTAQQVADLRSRALTAGRLYLMVAPPNFDPPATAPWAGKWVGVDLPDGMTYQSAMNTCNATLIDFAAASPPVFNNATGAAAVKVNDRRDQNKQVVAKAEGNLEFQSVQNPGICLENKTYDDKCGRAGETAADPGVTIPIMLGYAMSGAFADVGVQHTARLLTTFRLLCFKRSDRKEPGKDVPTACSLAPTGFDWEKVAVGTMYGYLDYALPTFSGKYSLGTSGSTSQRLILVR